MTCNKGLQQDSNLRYCDHSQHLKSSRPWGKNIIGFYTCISCFLYLSRMSPCSMTVTSWKRGAPCDPHRHLWPPPRRSAALSPSVRRSSVWNCPGTRPTSCVSLSPCPSPRVHRVDWGCRRHRNPRRSLEWDFDALVSLSITREVRRVECIVWNTCCVCRRWTKLDLWNGSVIVLLTGIVL